MTKLTTFRKSQIEELSDFARKIDDKNNSTDLIGMVNEEEISLIIDLYEDEFDGLIVYDGNKFFIHINTYKGNSLSNIRHRFTLAHELGHYHIPEHSENLYNGKLHLSSFELQRNTSFEIEADYFASCLLMPKEPFRAKINKRKINANLISELAKYFHVSKLSCLLRFCEIGTHEILIVFSSNGIVRWFKKSDDFPFLKNKFEIGNGLPKKSLAASFYNRVEKFDNQVTEESTSTWFYSDIDATLYEHCIYSEIYNYTASILWFD